MAKKSVENQILDMLEEQRDALDFQQMHGSDDGVRRVRARIRALEDELEDWQAKHPKRARRRKNPSTKKNWERAGLGTIVVSVGAIVLLLKLGLS